MDIIKFSDVLDLAINNLVAAAEKEWKVLIVSYMTRDSKWNLEDVVYQNWHTGATIHDIAAYNYYVKKYVERVEEDEEE